MVSADKSKQSDAVVVSSDDDDEDIPSTLPSISISPSNNSLHLRHRFGRPTTKRSLKPTGYNSNDPSHPPSKKQRVAGFSSRPASARLPPTPAPSINAKNSEDHVIRDGSIDASADENVSPIFLNNLNAPLNSGGKSRGPPKASEDPDTPSRQLMSESLVQGTDEVETEGQHHTIEHGSGDRGMAEFDDGNDRGNRTSQGSPEASTSSSHDKAADQDVRLGDIVEGNRQEDERDPYEIPDSSEKRATRKHNFTHLPSSRGEEALRPNHPLRKSRPIHGASRMHEVSGQQGQKPIPIKQDEAGRAEIPLKKPRGRPKKRRHKPDDDASRGDADKAQPGVVDDPHKHDDDGEMADIDLSVEYSFEHDVEDFKSRPVKNSENLEIFAEPEKDSYITIKLGNAELRKALTLVKGRAWARTFGAWSKWRSFDCSSTKTKRGKNMLRLLQRLQRFYDKVPGISEFKWKVNEHITDQISEQIRERNRFLYEHGAMLSYYFLKIQQEVDYIRNERLALNTDISSRNHSSRKRKEMANDLVQCIIPMLFYVLLTAWSCAGDDYSGNSFTILTVQFVGRTTAWIKLLLAPLLKEVKDHPLEGDTDDEHLDYEKWPGSWQKDFKSREQLEPLVQDLQRVIKAAPHELEIEERWREGEIELHEEMIRRKAEHLTQQQKKMEAQKRVNYEKIRLSMMSIPRRRKQITGPSEAELYLGRKIMDVYPDLPDLDDISWNLNKTLEETEAMAKDISWKVISEGYKQWSSSARESKFGELWDAYYEKRKKPRAWHE